MVSATLYASATPRAKLARARSSRAARGRGPPPHPNRRDLLLGLGTSIVTDVGFSGRATSSASPLPASPATLPSPRPGPEFESVILPRYPGFVTLPSQVQVRDLCVPRDFGDGDSKSPSPKLGDKVLIRYGLWTVHQGRNVVEPPTSINATINRNTEHGSFSFVIGDGTVIPAIEQAILNGMHLGGVRRVLVPPKASISYKYVPVEEAATKYGRAPVQDVKFGAQVIDGSEKPYPGNDAQSIDWVQYVVTRNAFTIKPTDRSILFDLKIVELNGRNATDKIRVATNVDQVGGVNDSSEDGGASWWTIGLPKSREYCSN